MDRLGVLRAVTTHTDQGLVLAHDLRAAGVSGKELAAAARAGDVSRVLRGVYRVGRLDDELLRARAALRYAGQGALVTGLLGCRLHGLRWVPPTDVVHVLVGPDVRRAPSELWVRVRRCRDAVGLESTWVDGIPVAPVTQCLLDAARESGSLRDVRGLVLGAVADRRCTTEQLRHALARTAVAGTAHVRRACLDAERGAASPPEAELVDALLPSRVPFYVNCEVLLGDALLGVTDVWLVGTGVGGEMDSKERHGDADLLDATLARDKRFSRAGLVLEHVTPTRFRAAREAFVALLLREAARRRACGQAEPPDLRLVPHGPLLP